MKKGERERERERERVTDLVVAGKSCLVFCKCRCFSCSTKSTACKISLLSTTLSNAHLKRL